MKNLVPTLMLPMLALGSQSLFASDVVVAYEPSEYTLEYDIGFDRTAVDSLSSPNVRIAEFSAETPLLKSSDVGYTGPSIYGGYQFETSNPEWIFNREEIRFNHKGVHPITLQSYSNNGWANTDMALHAAFLFKKDDFKAPFNKEDVMIEGLSVKWATYFTGAERNVSGRYMVEIDSKYYVSDFDFNMTNNGFNQMSKQQLAGVEWAPYDPEKSLDFDAGTAVYQPLKLSGVTAVGIYVEEDKWFGDGSLTSPYMLGIAGFEAKGVVQ